MDKRSWFRKGRAKEEVPMEGDEEHEGLSVVGRRMSEEEVEERLQEYEDV